MRLPDFRGPSPDRGRVRRLDVELSAPLEDVQLGPDEDGLGLVGRWRGHPVAFELLDVPAGALVVGTEVADLLLRSGGAAIAASRLAGELGVASPIDRTTTLSVVLCTHGRPDLAERCLRAILASVARSTEGGAPPAEVVLVDNDPPDDRTRLVADSLPVSYVREVRAGLDFARNRGWREASGDVVAYVDDDVVVDAGWSEGLRTALALHPDAGAVTGLVLPYALDAPAQVTFEARGGFRRGFEPLRYAGPTQPGNRLFPTGAGMFGAGCNMAYRREVLVALDGFDEALDTGRPLPGGGDIDMFYRVVHGGWPLVYEPSYLVFHEHRRTHAELRRQYWTWGTGFSAYVSKHLWGDPSMRGRFAALLVWWLRYQCRNLARSARRERDMIDLVAAETAGGIVGLFGMYRRSQRRTEAIRVRAANASTR